MTGNDNENEGVMKMENCHELWSKRIAGIVRERIGDSVKASTFLGNAYARFISAVTGEGYERLKARNSGHSLSSSLTVWQHKLFTEKIDQLHSLLAIFDTKGPVDFDEFFNAFYKSIKINRREIEERIVSDLNGTEVKCDDYKLPPAGTRVYYKYMDEMIVGEVVTCCFGLKEPVILILNGGAVGAYSSNPTTVARYAFQAQKGTAKGWYRWKYNPFRIGFGKNSKTAEDITKNSYEVNHSVKPLEQESEYKKSESDNEFINLVAISQYAAQEKHPDMAVSKVTTLASKIMMAIPQLRKPCIPSGTSVTTVKNSARFATLTVIDDLFDQWKKGKVTVAKLSEELKDADAVLHKRWENEHEH